MTKIIRQEPSPECEHFKTNGIRCGSPALRNRKFCFFHQRMQEIRNFRRERPNLRLDLPLLEDGNAIQIAVQEVISAVAEERIDPRRAGLMLYGLNTAVCNLRNVDFEPLKLREQAGAMESPVLQMLMDELAREPEWMKKPPVSNGTEEPPKALAG